MKHIAIMRVSPQTGGQLGSQDDCRLQSIRQFVDHGPHLIRIERRHCLSPGSAVPAFKI